MMKLWFVVNVLKLYTSIQEDGAEIHREWINNKLTLMPTWHKNSVAQVHFSPRTTVHLFLLVFCLRWSFRGVAALGSTETHLPALCPAPLMSPSCQSTPLFGLMSSASDLSAQALLRVCLCVWRQTGWAASGRPVYWPVFLSFWKLKLVRRLSFRCFWAK